MTYARVRRAVGVGLLVALCLLAGSCSGGGGAAPPTPSVDLYDKPASLPRISVGAPAWGDQSLPVKSLTTFDVVGSTAVLIGDDARGHAVVTAVDASTGKPHWSLRYGEGLGDASKVLWSDRGTVVGSGETAMVLVEYFSTACRMSMCAPGTVGTSDEEGVAALSVSDGSVRWTYAAIPSVKVGTAEARRLGGQDIRLVSPAEGRALVVIGPSKALNGKQYVDPKTIRTVGLDARTGKAVWTYRAVQAERVVNGVVIAGVPPAGNEGSLIGSGRGFVGLDPATGKQVWSRVHDHPQEGLMASTSTGVLLGQIKGSSIAGEALIGAANGRTMVRLKSPLPGTVATGDGPMMAWTPGTGRRLVTLTDTDKEPRTAAHQLPAGYDVADHVSGGYVFVSKLLSSGGAGSSVAVDRSGNQLSNAIHGHVLAMSDHLLVTEWASGSGPYDRFAVYRLKG